MGGRVSSWGLMCLLSTFLVIMLAMPASAYVSLGLSDGRCFDDGSFSMQVKNFGDTPTDLGRVKVTATMRDRDGDAFDVVGAFDRDSLYEGSSYTTTTMFRASTGNLNESGTYQVAVTYPDCRYGTCTEKIILERCPGFPYQCKLADLRIDKCFERGGALQLYVSGINRLQHEKIGPLRELALNLRSNARTISNTYYADGVTVKPHDDDGDDGEYIMSVPLKPGEKVYEASLELARCSEPPSLREIAICTIPANDPLLQGLAVAGRAEDASSEADIEDAAAKNTQEDRQTKPDLRIGKNRISGHAVPDTDASSSEETRDNVLPTLVMAGVVIIWLVATALVTALLVRHMKR